MNVDRVIQYRDFLDARQAGPAKVKENRSTGGGRDMETASQRSNLTESAAREVDRMRLRHSQFSVRTLMLAVVAVATNFAAASLMLTFPSLRNTNAPAIVACIFAIGVLLPALWFGAVRSCYDALLVHIAVVVTLAFLFLSALSTGQAPWSLCLLRPASPRRSSSLRSPGTSSGSWRAATRGTVPIGWCWPGDQNRSPSSASASASG